MENRQQDLASWMEIFLRKGHVNPMSFGDEPENPANTMEFMRKYGMDKIYNQYPLAKLIQCIFNFTNGSVV